MQHTLSPIIDLLRNAYTWSGLFDTLRDKTSFITDSESETEKALDLKAQSLVRQFRNPYMLIFLDPTPTPNKSEILGVQPDNPCFNKSTRSFWVTLKFKNHWWRYFMWE